MEHLSFNLQEQHGLSFLFNGWGSYYPGPYRHEPPYNELPEGCQVKPFQGRLPSGGLRVSITLDNFLVKASFRQQKFMNRIILIGNVYRRLMWSSFS